jgi:peptidoglycan/LPS O-acetylase OafA/YrhL
MGLLRILLAISVIVAHNGPIFGLGIVGGQVAVKAFYIISGFYMSLILNEKYVGNEGSYGLFLSNRLLRLFPIYWIVLALTVVASLAVGHASNGEYWLALKPYFRYHQDMGWTSIAFLVFTNLFLLGQDIVMFLGLDLHTGHLFFTRDFWHTSPYLYKFLLLPQAWTIGVEITFYLVAPFLVRRKPAVIALLIFLSLFIRILLIRNGLDKDPWNYRFFPSELMFFLLGNISYRIYKRIESANLGQMPLITITGALVLFTVFFQQVNIPYKEIVYYIAFFLSVPFIFKYTRRSRLDASIGDLSYPVYISHVFIMLFLGRLDFLARGIGPTLTVTIFSLGFAFILNKLVSTPIERIRQRRVLQPAGVLAVS